MTVNFERRSLLSRIVRRFQGFDGLLAFAVIVLGCAGLITMYSSGHDHGNQFANHGRNMLIAGACLFFVAQIPPQRLMRLAVPLYIFGVALLIAVAIFGVTKKGARRWVNIGIVIQPSEIMKIAMPLMLAWWFQKREGQLRPIDFGVALLLLAIPVGLIVRQPDLGTAILVMVAGLAVIFFAGLKWRWIAPPIVRVGSKVHTPIGGRSGWPRASRSHRLQRAKSEHGVNKSGALAETSVPSHGS